MTFKPKGREFPKRVLIRQNIFSKGLGHKPPLVAPPLPAAEVIFVTSIAVFKQLCRGGVCHRIPILCCRPFSPKGLLDLLQPAVFRPETFSTLCLSLTWAFYLGCYCSTQLLQPSLLGRMASHRTATCSWFSCLTQTFQVLPE